MNNKTWTKLGLVALLSLGLSVNANAGSREQAQRIHERICLLYTSDAADE